MSIAQFLFSVLNCAPLLSMSVCVSVCILTAPERVGQQNQTDCTNIVRHVEINISMLCQIFPLVFPLYSMLGKYLKII